jgi:hypothetical protein
LERERIKVRDFSSLTPSPGANAWHIRLLTLTLSSLEEERKLARVAALNCWRSHAKLDSLEHRNPRADPRYQLSF